MNLDAPEIFNAMLEKCLIGAMILDNSLIADVSAIVKPDDYFFENNRAIHSLIVEMNSARSAVDFNLIHDWAKRKNLKEIDIAYVASCIDELPDARYAKSNIEDYQNRILEYSRKRKLRTAFQNAVTMTANGIDTEQIIFTHKQSLEQIEREISGRITPLIIPADEFLKTEIPKREEIISTVLHTSSLAMVYGFRGRGKTYFLLSMAIAIATGSKFLSWDVPFPRSVIFVDGEMPEDELQQRLNELIGAEKIGNLYLLTSHNFHKKYNRYLNLNTPIDQQFFFRQLEFLERDHQKPEVIFLDNISTLAAGGDENLSLDQEPYIDFSRQLRHKGYCAIWAHHAGKNQDQRGASKREDILDLSINLAEPSTPAIAGASFRMEFTKVRGRMPKPYSLECELITDESGRLSWAYEIPERTSDVLTDCLQFINDYKPTLQMEIGQELNLSKYQVIRAMKKAREKGFVKDLDLTQKGTEFLSKIRRQK